jgi:uncharacterized protein YkwD
VSNIPKSRERAIGWRRAVCNGLVLSSALLCPPLLAQDQDRLIHLINAYRQSPEACAGFLPRAAGPLSPEPRLAAVDLSQGGEQALKKAGLHIIRMEAISVSGPSSAVAAMQAIRNRYCKAIADPEYILIGTSRSGNTWRVVLARPRLAQAPADLVGAGKQILDLANAARAKERTCGTKRYRATRPLVWNAALEDAARMHSRDMANNNYFAHTSRNGARAGERAQQAGYRWQRIGENIAAGQEHAKSVVDGWLSSPGHCANLMSPHFTEMGAAYAINEKSDLLIYWTQILGTPR